MTIVEDYHMESPEQFVEQVKHNIDALGQDRDMRDLTRIWLRDTVKHSYSYNFTWLGRPIIQYPQDILAMQEIIWGVQPDLIIETGIAHGGSLVFSASMLELNAACGGPQNAEVLGIDIDIRPHNRAAIEAHPIFKRISLIEGSSIAPEVISQVHEKALDKKRVLVCLDSMHTHDHVLAELKGYAPLVTVGSYCVVFDTIIEDLPPDLFPDRPWSRGDNPKTAVHEWLSSNTGFEIDKTIEHKLLITVAPDGYLKRVRE